MRGQIKRNTSVEISEKHLTSFFKQNIYYTHCIKSKDMKKQIKNS